jgi:hypothetical protein
MAETTAEYVAARPYVKGAVAFVIWLRMPVWTQQQCFDQAEAWLKKLEDGGA